MSNFTPLRPAAETWSVGRPMKKDSKRIKTGFGFRRHLDDPSSDISLPIPESIQSSMSSDSEYGSYKIGKLEALAPRPTLRYATCPPRWGPPNANTTSGPFRTTSQRRRFTERSPIPEATLRAHKRVDDLADDLDASDLRELMERDQRRRERKRQREQERIERRLARRAEKQRAEELAAVERGSQPPQNLERGVMGRELVGLGIDPTSAVVTSSRRRASDATPEPVDTTEDSMDIDDSEASRPTPLDHFHRMNSIPLEAVTPVEEVKEPPPVEPTSIKPKKLRKSRSKSPRVSNDEKLSASPTEETKIDKGESPRKASGRLSFTNFFKWGGKGRRSSGPSSFSNTSREEMQAAAAAQTLLPPPPIITNPVIPVRKASAGMPKRTMSRFREDLPELPLSPPDSRIQSPEVEISNSLGLEDPIDHMMPPVGVRSGTPTSGNRSIVETTRQTPTSLHRYDNQASPEPPSISLASIDSEASWLSGRITGKRSSGMRETMKPRHQRHARTASDDSMLDHADEEFTIGDDEYFTRLSPSAEMAMESATPRETYVEEGLPSSDEEETLEDSDMKWGSVHARQRPMLVQAHEHDAEMVKSRVGILNTDDEDENETEGGKAKDSSPDLQRATSINLGQGHVRHISAGSAKLLDLSPRSSGEAKRFSSERRSSGLAFI
jgi:hypothetical protein